MFISEWLSSLGFEEDFENLDNRELDKRLERFYPEVWNAEGQNYSKSTFTGLRASINRYLRGGAPYSKNVCLMSNPDFHRSNQMFVGMLKKLKRDGLDRTRHYPPIAEADIRKLRESDTFSLEQPKPCKEWFGLILPWPLLDEVVKICNP